jgi:hypothetical protein
MGKKLFKHSILCLYIDDTINELDSADVPASGQLAKTLFDRVSAINLRNKPNIVSALNDAPRCGRPAVVKNKYFEKVVKETATTLPGNGISQWSSRLMAKRIDCSHSNVLLIKIII